MKLFRFLFVSRHDILILSICLVLFSRESEAADGQLSGSDYGVENSSNPSIQHLEPCGAVIRNTSNGVIESPNYPDSYPSSVNCEWTVQAEEGQIIQVTFFDIRTQTPTEPFGEVHDYLDVSLTGRAKDTQRYSGDLNAITPFTLITEGNKLYVRFHSEHNHDPAYTGFRLAYHVTNVTILPPAGAIAATCKLTSKDVTPENIPTTDTLNVDSKALRQYEEQLDLEFEELEKVNRTNPHPYLVALVLDDNQFCSGTLVRNDFVLTSAYCTQGVENIEMIFGTADTNVRDAGVQRRFATMKEVIPHPYFDSVTGVNDISLIRLNEPVKVSDFVKAIRLPSWSLLGNVFSGTGVKIAGWGESSGSHFHFIPLQYGSISSFSRGRNLFISPNAACRSSLFKGVTGMMMCSKKQATQRCQADLGSPITTRCGNEDQTRKKPNNNNNNKPGLPPPPDAPDASDVIPPVLNPGNNEDDSSQQQFFPQQPPQGPPQTGFPKPGQGPPSFIPSGVPPSCYRFANSIFLSKQQSENRMDIYRPRKSNNRPQKPSGKPNKRPQRPSGKPNKRPQKPGGKPNKRPQKPGGKPNKRPQRPGTKPNKRPQKPGGKPNKRPQRPGGKPNKRPQRPGKPNKRPQRPGKPNKRPQRPGKPNKRPQRPGKPNKRPQRPSGKPNKRPQRPGGKPNKRPQRPVGKPNKRPQRPGGKPNKRPQRPQNPNQCQGYSRSPNVLLGVVSFGSCNNGFVFTRITAYMDFLSDNMGSWYE